LLLTALDSCSAISICDRWRSVMSFSAICTFPLPLDTRAVTARDSGTSVSTSRLMSSV